MSVSAQAPRRPPIQTRWLALGVFLALGLISAGGYHYWLRWRENRFNEYYRDRAYRNVLSRFLNDVKQGRLNEAYDATSAGFQQRVSREEFAKEARPCVEFHAKPDAPRRVAASQDANVDRGYRSEQLVTETDVLRDSEGNQLDLSTTVIIVDSIFYSRLPVPLVDDFSVTYTRVASEQQKSKLVK